MNWLNQDWEHELQHTEMYVIEARRKAEEELEQYYLEEKKLPAIIKIINQKKENEHSTISINNK